MLNRRNFNGLILAALAVRPESACAATKPQQDTLWLNRLTFGASPQAREEMAKLGPVKWLDEQLAMPPMDAELSERLNAARLWIDYAAESDQNGHHWPARKEHLAYQYLDLRGEKLVPLIEWEKSGMAWEERIRPMREVQAAALTRATHAKAQLREVMTQFWHNHFNVNAGRDERTAAFFAVYDKMLRDNAFGNFRKLLGEVAKSPAMLFYLNNESSRASPANENFARELFELHTLGAAHYLNDKTTSWHDVPGAEQGKAAGYIDQDVYEAARAMTGWSVGDGRWVSEGEYAPVTGEFLYIDAWHDPYQKRILGVEFNANEGPLADGEKLLDLVAYHPATAEFVCTKICRRLCCDEPSEALLAKAIKTWREAMQEPDQIARTLRAIVLSQEFSTEPPRKLKQPLEFLVSLYRAMGADVASPSLNYTSMLSRAGWNQHECRPPTGHPDHSTHWANTALLSTYAEVALNALEEWTEAGRVDLATLVPQPGMKIAELSEAISLRMSASKPPPETISALIKAMAGDENATVPEAQGDREWVVKSLVAAAALDPNFLFR